MTEVSFCNKGHNNTCADRPILGHSRGGKNYDIAATPSKMECTKFKGVKKFQAFGYSVISISATKWEDR